jgi:hypothetical protein
MRLIALPAVRARRNAADRSADVSVGDAVDGGLNLNSQFMHEIGHPGCALFVPVPGGRSERAASGS